MEQINSNKKHSDRRKYFALLAVVLFIALSGAYAYWSMELKDMISTDDAYVTPRFYVSTSKSIIKALINMHSFEIQLSPIG